MYSTSVDIFVYMCCIKIQFHSPSLRVHYCQWCLSFSSKLVTIFFPSHMDGSDNWLFWSAIQFPAFLNPSNTTLCVHFSWFFAIISPSLCPHPSEIVSSHSLLILRMYVYLICIAFTISQLLFTFIAVVAAAAALTDCEFYRLFHEISLWLPTSVLLILVLFANCFSTAHIFFPLALLSLIRFHLFGCQFRIFAADLITHTHKK